MQVGLKAEFELVLKSERCSFALREFKLPAFASPWHFHSEIELTSVVQSRGRRFVGDHIAPFAAGDLVLLTAILMVADGPRSPLVVGYPLVIVLATLRLNLPLVRFATLGAAAGYLILLGYARWYARVDA